MYLPDHVDLAVKLVVASILSFGWAAILHPFVRKSQKSWDTLTLQRNIT
jgi:hypothetical protein